jgi:maltooligosyltrehalose trehalohydrolase
VFKNYNKNDIAIDVLNEDGILVYRRSEDGLQHVVCVFNFSDLSLSLIMPKNSPEWKNILNSRASQWMEAERDEDPLPYRIREGDKLNVPGCSILVYESGQ